MALFEATHGTAPKYAGQDKVNPGSVILSGVMMFRHLGWHEAADLIETGIEKAVAREARDLRPGPPDGGRHRAQDLAVRRHHHRQHVAGGPATPGAPRRVRGSGRGPRPSGSVSGRPHSTERTHEPKNHGRAGPAMSARLRSGSSSASELADVVLVDILEGRPRARRLDIYESGPSRGPTRACGAPTTTRTPRTPTSSS